MAKAYSSNFDRKRTLKNTKFSQLLKYFNKAHLLKLSWWQDVVVIKMRYLGSLLLPADLFAPPDFQSSLILLGNMVFCQHHQIGTSIHQNDQWEISLL